MSKTYFGTDGIRGRTGVFPVTPGFFLDLGLAAGTVFANRGANRVIIGKDTRISGYMFESALEAGFSAAGMDVLLLGPMPTPAVAYLTRTFNASIGVVISASHNPYHDNGIKFFSKSGMKITEDTELQIEKNLEKQINIVDSLKLGKARRIDDAPGRYIEHCKATVHPALDLSDLHIVVDSANGATYQVGPQVFSELGAKVTVIGNQPDGLNINKNCGSTCPETIKKAVDEHNADLGIAFDGDGDRVIMIDEAGEVVDGDEILFVIAAYHFRKKSLVGGVVGTVMSNFGLEKALASMGIPFIRSKVGDRHVNKALFEKGWTFGGESSGHIICRDVSTTGDGIVAALQVLSAINGTGKPLSELRKEMTRYPQQVINVPVKKKRDIMKNASLSTAISAVENELGDRGRVLLRPSGTEPVIRVMVEGENPQEVDVQAKYLANIVEELVS